ncbi:hypothetical protein [Sporosarcina highlanderae]|uniref:Death domain-containing protein n=1 Tax=Sporosarcina highlanderae TaxID=3035916 RepID=A0ABT8JTA1_9BACL|nr:hypothetical protein [Sporosarcina highlanderae]MDN4608122.1 hypothetical protein [Sporosarcina highlanderae]
MKIRLGVIGPSDSIEIVKKAVEEFDEITLLPFPYEEMEETREIILENRRFVDQWFFSGQAPYYYAVTNNLIREEEGSFAPLNSNSIYKTLLEAQLQEGKIFNRISLDTVQETEVEIKKSIKSMELYTFPYSGYLPIQEIIDFHLDLFREGKVDVAVTCVNTVYHTLKELGIPCYRVAPDIIAVRLIIQYLKQRGVSQWYRKAQIAILGVEIIQLDWANYSYKTKYQELELKKLLLNYSERINGSFIEIGDGRYFIYTTRGEVELQLNEDSLFKLIERSDLQSKLQIRIGLGYGATSLEAEQHARLATQYAREKKEPIIVIMDELKQITEYGVDERPLSYNNRLSTVKWNELLRNANISPATVNRIQSMALYYKKTEITSKELSVWMNSTERNARRILMELESVNLAKITGEEQSGQRGRPRKVYELQFIDEK